MSVSICLYLPGYGPGCDLSLFAEVINRRSQVKVVHLLQ